MPATEARPEGCMKKRYTGLFIPKWLWVFILAFPFHFFPWILPYAQGGEKIRVITTLFPLQEFAVAVGGDRARVDLLLPPGAEPHAWEPKPSDLAKIQKADVFVYINRAMEPWAEDLLKASGGGALKIVEASKGLHLLESKDPHGESSPAHKHPREERIDPHVWLDFALDGKIIEAIAAAFAEKDPANAPHFRARAKEYRSRLEALDEKYQTSLAQCRHRQIILGGHSAFAYLARRYNLQQVPLYGVSPNAEPTPKRLAEVIQAAKTHGVKFIFFEEMVNPKLARVLAQEAGLQTLVLYDGANLTRDQLKQKVTFLELMEKNLKSLRQGLDCGPK